MSFFFTLMLHVVCNIFHWQPRMLLLNYENGKMHFSLCDFSEIAKPKVNEMA